VDEAVLDGEVLADELGGQRVVGEDAAHLCRRREHVFGPLRGEELPRGGRVGEVEFL